MIDWYVSVCHKTGWNNDVHIVIIVVKKNDNLKCETNWNALFFSV
jgi:hypothetical protein